MDQAIYEANGGKALSKDFNWLTISDSLASKYSYTHEEAFNLQCNFAYTLYFHILRKSSVDSAYQSAKQKLRQN